MSKQYKQNSVITGVTRFTKSPMADVEFSRMTANPIWLTSFNAGDIVPVYYSEVLPHDTFSMSVDYVIRQTTSLLPVMGQMNLDLYAFFVPNRIVNESWKNVMGENSSGTWSAPKVDLAPLYTGNESVRIPVGSVADYYGFPTQAPILPEHLKRMNDLKFRGYLEIYNNYFRDQNYQAPIPYSKLNVYEGFLEGNGVPVNFSTVSAEDSKIPRLTQSDGSFPNGAVVKALYGEGAVSGNESSISLRLSSWSASDKPLKANKFHDFITSSLPSPQKGAEVYFGIGDVANVYATDSIDTTVTPALKWKDQQGNLVTPNALYSLLGISADGTSRTELKAPSQDGNPGGSGTYISPANLQVDLSNATGISVNDLRTAIATQQVYETLARGGSRYLEVIKNFFELETSNPFSDIPTYLGHIRNALDLYQVAQTSPSSDKPLANLAAFGYTDKGGQLFNRTFLEHGYIHVFAVVRQRNIYSTYLAPDNFRMSTLDYYLPQLANIGEQPIPLRTLNPFKSGNDESAIGFQEAWWDYRFEPDRTSGYMRSGIDGSLETWTYADNYDSTFDHVNGDWLRSNAEEVLNRSLSVTSSLAPQFIAQFSWKVDKQRPLPVYSIPGLDII